MLNSFSTLFHFQSMHVSLPDLTIRCETALKIASFLNSAWKSKRETLLVYTEYIMDNIRREDIYRSTQTISFPDEEQIILSYWTVERIFENGQSFSSGNKTYTFYDGPPFATGLPHYGHILAGTIKDIITRFKYQQGFHVDRRFGWDCHGLPVEYEIDKKLGIKDRKQVASIGIAAYNQECRKIVMRYSSEWRTVIGRMGRWIDFDNDYKTMYPWYMESIWWVFKQLFEKGLVYRGVKVMPFSTHCGTPLSNFEAGENYKLVQDPSIIVSFDILDEDDTSFLAWTTTPWTLPTNLALCVNPNHSYVKVKTLKDGRSYIICESRLDDTFKGIEEFAINARFSGIQLAGRKYKPIFPYFEDYGKKMDCFRVICDDYVSMDHGTGVVHQAPYFGEDDYRVCLKNGIITKASEVICPVDDSGCFTGEVTHFAGQYIKDADKNIIRWLEENNSLFHVTQLTHNYPFCWRSDTPLIYKAVPSWFIRVEHLSDELLKCTDETYWVPEFVKTNRFRNWLKNTQDWSVSRNRFWGTPIPIWTNGKEILCIGSKHELEVQSGCTINDLHRDSIDHIKIPSSIEGSSPLERIDEVFDCWFESGSMPFAHRHYPFENKGDFAKYFPADFIAEGIDQTRGWFYTLIVISTALFGKPPFRNLIANGLVLAPDGKKMSKRKKNYPDPLDVVNKYGADSLRLFLINSPVVRGENLRFREGGVRDILKDMLIPLFNAYRFLVQNINRLEQDSGTEYFYDREKYHQERMQRSLIDDWIISCKETLLDFFTNEMELYRLYTVVPRLMKFIDLLTNWYIRLNRRRIKGEMGTIESINSINVLYSVVSDIVKVMAPFTPFFSEYVYHCLKLFETKSKLKSVHYERMPVCDKTLININIEKAVSLMQRVIELGRIIRDRCCLPLRHPLKEIIVIHENTTCLDQIRSLEAIILSELNVKILTLSSNIDEFGVKMVVKPNYKLLGSRLKSKLKSVASAIENATSQDIQKWVRSGYFDILGESISQSDILLSYEKSLTTTSMEIERENDILVLINTEQSEELRREGLARDIINRIQALKKKANLLPTDLVSVCYCFQSSNDDSIIRKVVKQFRCLIESTIKSRVIELKNFSDLHGSALVEDDIQLADEQIHIAIKQGAREITDCNMRTVRLFLDKDIEPRYGAKREGTVCLTYPSGERLAFSHFRNEVETLFGLYGVQFKMKCCTKDIRCMEDLTFPEVCICRKV